MNSRERVIRALEFENPDRVPRDLWWLPAVEMFKKKELDQVLEKFPMDIDYPEFDTGRSEVQSESSLPNYNIYGLENPKKGEYLDEWGSVWRVAEDGVVGEVKEPILSDLEELEKLEVPWDFLNTTSFHDVDDQCAESDCFTISGIAARPFERMQFIRGTENLFKDLVKEEKKIIELKDRIHEYNKAHIRKWLDTDVDGIWLMDDWGAQNNLLISPGQWRELLKPLYREYCDLIHDHNKYVFFHSDGWIEEIYPDIIEIGIDAINSQLFTMDLEKLANYKGEITFWGEVDRQYLLPFGEPDEIKREIYKLRKMLGDSSGGMIAQCEWGKENPKENVEAVFEAWEIDKDLS